MPRGPLIGRKYAQFPGAPNRRGPTANVEFPEDGAHMVADAVLAQTQSSGNVLVTLHGKSFEHFALFSSEHRNRRVYGRQLPEHAFHAVREHPMGVRTEVGLQGLRARRTRIEQRPLVARTGA